MDQSQLTISDGSNFDVNIYAQSEECEKCPLWYYTHIPRGKSSNLVVNATYPTVINITGDDNNYSVCSLRYHFGDRGEYFLNISTDSLKASHCEIQVTKAPCKSQLVVLWMLLAIVGVAVLWIMYKKFMKWRRNISDDVQLLISDLGSPHESMNTHSNRRSGSFGVSGIRNRIGALDAFRGLCIIIMIFVNYGGGGFWFFKHSVWNGLTVADLVFPWFMFIMGAAMALSLQAQLRRAIPKKTILWQIFQRAFILFTLGILVSQIGKKVDLTDLRILGVLQRFGISYFIVAAVHLAVAKPGDVHQISRWTSFQDIVSYWPEWILSLVMLATHVCLTFLLSVPGCPKGYLGPGGLHFNAQFPNCTGGAAGYFDRVILGESHLYQNPTCKSIYDTSTPFDPEGLLGYLTATFVVFLGLQAGKIIVSYPYPNSRLIRWIVWSLILGCIGTLLCKASKNNGWIPINKNLWSVSYIFVTTSMAFKMLSVFYFIIDVRKWWSGTPLIYPGMNAIVLYVGHEVTRNMFPFSWGNPDSHWEYLIMNACGTTLWIFISVMMYKAQFFISL